MLLVKHDAAFLIRTGPRVRPYVLAATPCHLWQAYSTSNHERPLCTTSPDTTASARGSWSRRCQSTVDTDLRTKPLPRRTPHSLGSIGALPSLAADCLPQHRRELLLWPQSTLLATSTNALSALIASMSTTSRKCTNAWMTQDLHRAIRILARGLDDRRQIVAVADTVFCIVSAVRLSQDRLSLSPCNLPVVSTRPPQIVDQKSARLVGDDGDLALPVHHDRAFHFQYCSWCDAIWME